MTLTVWTQLQWMRKRALMREQNSRCANTILQLKWHRSSPDHFDRRKALTPQWWTKTFLCCEVLNRSTVHCLVQSNMNHWQHKATSDDRLALTSTPFANRQQQQTNKRHESSLCICHCSSNWLWFRNLSPNKQHAFFFKFLFYFQLLSASSRRAQLFTRCCQEGALSDRSIPSRGENTLQTWEISVI